MALKTSIVFGLIIVTASFGLEIELSANDYPFTFVHGQNGLRIHVHNGVTPPPGYPWIEFAQVILLLPEGRKVRSVRIIEDNAEKLGVTEPIEKCIAKRLDGSGEIVRDSKVAFLASTPVELVSNGCAMGYSIAVLRFSPVTMSDDGELLLHKKVKLDLKLERGKNCIKPMVHTEISRRAFRKVLDKFLIVDSVFESYEQSEILADYFLLPHDGYSVPPRLSDSPADVVVITSSSLEDTARAYLDETRYGIATRFVTIEDIYAHYSASDGAEAIRNFIKDAYRLWGIWAVFLVGDYTVIPVRELVATNYRGEIVATPSDLYYAALDGSLNSDGDDEFGESPSDDLFPEIFYGRLEVKSTAEIRTFANKLHEYLFNFPDSFFNRILFVGGSIYPSGTDNTGPQIKDQIVTRTGVDTIFELTKMYSNISTTGGDVTISRANFISFLDSGYAMINHFDHGNQTLLSFGMYTGGGVLNMADIYSLDNDYYPVLYSFSCDVNRLDTDNMARRWVINPSGGGVAMFAHSNTAWSIQYYMDLNFWSSFIDDTCNSTGELLFDWVYSLSSRAYDRIIASLCGSPTIPITPRRVFEESLTVYPSTLFVGDSIVRIYVNPPLTRLTLITISTKDRILSRKYFTGDRVSLRVPLVVADTVFITLHTLPRKHISVPLHPSLSGFVVPCSAWVEVVRGDRDGFFELGETAVVKWELTNAGGGIVFDTLTMRTVGVATLEDTIHVRMNPSETTVVYSDTFSADSVFWGESIGISYLRFSSSYIDSFIFSVCAPELQIISTSWSDSDGIPFFGDSGVVSIRVANKSCGDMRGCVIKFDSPLIHFLEDSFITDILADSFVVIEVSATIGTAGVPNFRYLVNVKNSFAETTLFGDLHALGYPDSIYTIPGQGYCEIHWESMPDAYAYYVLRSLDSINFVYLTPYPIYNSFYIDSTLGDSIYYYSIVAIDSSGVCGKPSPAVPGWKSLRYKAGFPVDLPIGCWPIAAPLIVDVDGDGRKEIFVVDNNGHITAYRCDGTELHDISSEVDPIFNITCPSGMGFWSTPAAGELDNDGIVYIVVASRTYPGKIWAIRGDGVVKSGFPVTTRSRMLSSVALYDLDGDSTLEIIACDESHYLYIIKSDGTPYVGSSTLVDSSYLGRRDIGSSAPAIGDIDGDGLPEIVVCGGKDTAGLGYIYAWNSDGTRASGFPVPVAGDSRSSPVLGNFDDDTSDMEIAVIVNGLGIVALDGDGTMLPGFPYTRFTNFGDGMRSLTLYDYDGDNKDEIIVQTQDSLCVIRYNGTELTGFPIPVGNIHWSTPVVADIDNDGIADMLITSNDRIYAYHFDGTPIKLGFPLEAGVAIVSTPAIDDIDNDGIAEIIVPAYDSRLYVWETSSRYINDPRLWMQFRHDCYRTASVGFSTGLKVGEGELVKPANAVINVYPNPFNSSVVIRGYIPEKGYVDVYDIYGRKVKRIGEISGKFKVVWDGSSVEGSLLPSGVYIVKVNGKSKNISKKVVFVK